MSDIFRPLFRSVEDKVANRRDQLRKAQKTFRERRDQYLRTLEKTVKRLHTGEASLQNEVERLRQDLTATKNQLLQREAELYELRQSSNGSPMPTGNNWGSSDFSSGANAYLSPASHVTTSESLSVTSSATTLVWIETEREQPVQMHIQRKDAVEVVSEGRAQGNDSGVLAVAPILKKQVTAYVSQLDVVVVAMEFVLRLESPCLPHIRQSDVENISSTVPDKESPDGHVHTASAALLCCSPSRSPLSVSSASLSNSSPAFSIGSSWSVHKATLDRLLDISDDLPVDQAQELTPVQVWYCISQTSGFKNLQVGGLDNMANRLLNHIKCYGFGAVVRRDFLTRMLAELAWQ